VKYRVTQPHEPEYSEGLIVRKGEKLKYERKPTAWPGWIWCTASNGRTAWVPESWVEFEGGFCVLSRDYNSKELRISEGDVVEVELEESGWAWVRNTAGIHGWVPLDRIAPEREGTALR
jgi:uncharacterized protein YgiM (DUF1202 family)